MVAAKRLAVMLLVATPLWPDAGSQAAPAAGQAEATDPAAAAWTGRGNGNGNGNVGSCNGNGNVANGRGNRRFGDGHGNHGPLRWLCPPASGSDAGGQPDGSDQDWPGPGHSTGTSAKPTP